MIMTGILFVTLAAIVKLLGDRIPPGQAVFLRYFLAVPILIPMWPVIRAAQLTGRQIKLFGLRGAAHTIAVIFWFYAMANIPLAEVTAMNYLSPVYVTLAAALFLGERLAMRRIAAVAAGIIGMLIILRPGIRELELGHLAMVATAILFAVGYLVAKILSGEVSATVVVGMLQITVTVGLLPFALLSWVAPTWAELGLLAMVAACATAGHYTMTLAFAAAPLSVTQPVTFLQLVWAVLIGALFFAEPVDGWVILGGTLIVAAISYLAWREAQLRKAQPPS